MKKVKLIIEIDDELLDYIRNEHYDKHLQQRFDCQSKWAIKNGKPLETELEEIKTELHKRIKTQYDACFGDKVAVCCYHQAYEVSSIIVDNVFEECANK